MISDMGSCIEENSQVDLKDNSFWMDMSPGLEESQEGASSRVGRYRVEKSSDTGQSRLATKWI